MSYMVVFFIMYIYETIRALKFEQNWTTLSYFYCNKRKLWHDDSIHVEREIKNDSLRARFANSSTQNSTDPIF